MCLSVVSKISFLPFFSVILRGSDETDEQKWPYSSSATKNQHESMFCFSFYATFYFNGHFRHFGRPYWFEDINGEGWFAIPYNADTWRA